MARSSAHGPHGLAHVNLVSGAVGVIDKITVVKGVKKDVAVDLLADPVVTGDPLAFAPKRLGGAGVAAVPVVPTAPCPPPAEAPPRTAAVPPLVPPSRSKRARVQPDAPMRASACIRGQGGVHAADGARACRPAQGRPVR